MKFFQVKSVEETNQLIEQHVTPISDTQILPIFDSLHHVLAEDIVAKENVPNFERSSVDGYAVKASDTFGASEALPAFFQLTGQVLMGEKTDLVVQTGEAIYVPTGGMIPEGSNAVVMIEHGEELGGLVNVYRQVAPGENIISSGEDVREGEVFLQKGTTLRPQELGAVAAQGIQCVTVRRKPVVGYLSSGDEIVPMDTDVLRPGLVRDMNAVTVGALVKQWGYPFVYGGIVRDDREELEHRARLLLDQVDFLILSGGSSVGTKDHSVEVIDSLGTPGVYVHGVAVKPGKPTIVANSAGKPVLGLPGHPASAMIIFHLFGKRILECLEGTNRSHLSHRQATLTRNLASAPGRTDYVRVRLVETEDGLMAEPIYGKSGLLSTLLKSDGMVEVPARSEGLHKGEQVNVRLFE